MSMEPYSEKDYQILDFIKENPGVNKETVCKKIDGKGIYSRITTLKRLEQFVKDGKVKAVKERPNSVRYHLFIDESNKASMFLQELRACRKHYFFLLTGVNQTIANSKGTKACRARHMPIEQTIGIVKEIMIGYFNQALGKWPIEIQDKEALHGLYSNVFSQLAEMNAELIQNTDDTHRLVGAWDVDQATKYYSWLQEHQLHQHLENMISAVKSWSLELQLFPHVSFVDLKEDRIVERSLEDILGQKAVKGLK